jgi:uncharacterized delta-60 repeat protein
MRFAFIAFALLIGVASASLALAGDGALDPSFGSNGTVFSNFSGDSKGYAVAFDPVTQKILAAGSSSVCGLVVARYNYNGTLDNTFGSSGKVCTFGAGAVARSIAIVADERILVAGSAKVNRCQDFALARYNSNGALDKSFGNNGIALTTATDCGQTNFGEGMAVQPDGRIVVAGGFGTSFTVLRYNSNGSLDNTFGAGGEFRAVGNYAEGVAIQPDGKIVVVGNGYAKGGASKGLIVRFNADGTLDNSFAETGVARNVGVIPHAVALTCSGKIVVAGEGGSGFRFARYNSNGTLDSSFGSNGIAFAFGSELAAAFSVAINPITEKIIGGGSVYDTRFGLARLNPNGSLDSSFGSNGQVITFGSGDDQGSSVVLLPTLNRTLFGGYVGSTKSHNFALARYIGD